MNKIVTLNALRRNSYSLFRKIPLMINMGVCAFCLVPAMVFAENTHEVTVLNAQQQTRKAVLRGCFLLCRKGENEYDAT